MHSSALPPVSPAPSPPLRCVFHETHTFSVTAEAACLGVEWGVRGEPWTHLLCQCPMGHAQFRADVCRSPCAQQIKSVFSSSAPVAVELTLWSLSDSGISLSVGSTLSRGRQGCFALLSKTPTAVLEILIELNIFSHLWCTWIQSKLVTSCLQNLAAEGLGKSGDGLPCLLGCSWGLPEGI